MGATLPLMYTLLSDLFPIQQRVKALGLMTIATGAGIAVGLMLGGFVADSFADKNVGWRVASAVAGAPAVLISPLLFLLADPPRGASEANVGDLVVGAPARFTFQDFARIVKIPTVALVFASVRI